MLPAGHSRWKDRVYNLKVSVCRTQLEPLSPVEQEYEGGSKERTDGRTDAVYYASISSVRSNCAFVVKSALVVKINMPHFTVPHLA